MDILPKTDHRLLPLPEGRWLMTQTWHNLLFAHWPVQPDALEGLVPNSLELDTFDGQAWLGIIPFRLSAVRLHGLPPVPFVSAFAEINVRTYVKHAEKPGVFFLSMDTDDPLTTAIARPWFRLPYYNASIHMHSRRGTTYFDCRRKQRSYASGGSAQFCGAYSPVSAPYYAKPCTLEHWLTERYCYYTTARKGKLYRCDIQHEQWPLQRARLHIVENTMALSHGINLPLTEPILHYARRMTALIWPLRKSILS